MIKNNIIIDTIINDDAWTSDIPQILHLIDEVKEASFNFIGAHENVDVLNYDKPLRISLCLSTDEEVRELNKNFRGKDKPTNVLTFANKDSQDFAYENAVFDEIDLGSIIIARETVIRESKAEKKTVEEHFSHLLVHGILHILGYDHIEDAQAEYMENLEISILANMNIDNPYNDDCL